MFVISAHSRTIRTLRQWCNSIDAFSQELALFFWFIVLGVSLNPIFHSSHLPFSSIPNPYCIPWRLSPQRRVGRARGKGGAQYISLSPWACGGCSEALALHLTSWHTIHCDTQIGSLSVDLLSKLCEDFPRQVSKQDSKILTGMNASHCSIKACKITGMENIVS